MDRIRLDLKITDYFDWTFDFEKEKRGSKHRSQRDLFNVLLHEIKVTLKMTGVLYFWKADTLQTILERINVVV